MFLQACGVIRPQNQRCECSDRQRLAAEQGKQGKRRESSEVWFLPPS
jgi:hypothetical protein